MVTAQRTRERASFALKDDALSQLEAIKARTRSANEAEIVRAALDCYDELIDVALSGCMIVVCDRKGNEWLYSPFAPIYPKVRNTRKSKRHADADGKRQIYAIPSSALSKLSSIRRRSRFSSNSEAIRAALDCYDELLAIVVDDKDGILIRNDETERAYTLFTPFQREGLARDTSLPIAAERPGQRHAQKLGAPGI